MNTFAFMKKFEQSLMSNWNKLNQCSFGFSWAYSIYSYVHKLKNGDLLASIGLDQCDSKNSKQVQMNPFFILVYFSQTLLMLFWMQTWMSCDI